MTTAPKPVVSHQASFDGNVANSGIVAFKPEGFVVTKHWIERYDGLLTKYGARLTPIIFTGDRVGVVAQGDNFLVTAQVLVRFTRMNAWRKAEQN
jgi:hypothetical protein